MKRISAGLVTVAAWSASAAAGEIAIDLDLAETTIWAYPNVQTNHGWDFNVTEALTVTHLGLLDVADFPAPGADFDITPDGLRIPHDLGLFDSSGSLLRSGMVTPGTSDLLVDGFRFVPIEHIELLPNTTYSVVFHTLTAGQPDVDYMVVSIPGFTANPAVEYVAARHGAGGVLELPPNVMLPGTFASDRFGPNFMFVPEPATALMVGLGACGLLRRRRHAG